MTIDRAVKPEANGEIHHNGINPSKVLPGTTFPPANGTAEQAKKGSHISTQSQPGPTINNKPTTVTRYESRDLKAAGQVPAIHDLVNVAFAEGHSRSGTIPGTSLRLQSHEQLVKELSSDGTFTYVVTYTGTDVVIATASAKRYKGTMERQAASIDNPKSAFMRSGTFKPNTEGWELSSMAVDPGLQRKGLAGVLMGFVEGEVKRRFAIHREETGVPELGLVMMLTTVKEINGEFYARRGYQVDYETFHGPGWLGSAKGFSVMHMSKQVEV